MEVEDKRTDGSVEFSKINVGECFFSTPDMLTNNVFLKTMSFIGKTDCNAVSPVTGFGFHFKETEKVYPAKVKVVIE